ncbi:MULTISPECIES: DUF1127 domain-containing protein [unclassified Marinovum]
MANIITNTPVHAGPVQRLQAALQAISTRYAQYRVYRTTLRELQSLTARELADLGLNHSEIRRVAYHAAYN